MQYAKNLVEWYRANPTYPASCYMQAGFSAITIARFFLQLNRLVAAFSLQYFCNTAFPSAFPIAAFPFSWYFLTISSSLYLCFVAISFLSFCFAIMSCYFLHFVAASYFALHLVAASSHFKADSTVLQDKAMGVTWHIPGRKLMVVVASMNQVALVNAVSATTVLLFYC